jgi:hypothetical protein
MREQSEWQAPVGDTLKINTDGSYSELTGVGGWGFVVLDKEGTIRGAGAGYVAHVASVAGTEAITCQEGLQVAASWGRFFYKYTPLSNLIIENAPAKKYCHFWPGGSA